MSLTTPALPERFWKIRGETTVSTQRHPPKKDPIAEKRKYKSEAKELHPKVIRRKNEFLKLITVPYVKMPAREWFLNTC